MNILSLYFIFVLLSLLCLLAFRVGYSQLVMAASIALWLVGQFFDPLAYLISANALPACVNFFNIFSWQLLWMVGLYLGCIRKEKLEFSWFQHPAFVSIALILVIFFLQIRHEWLPIPADWSPLFERRQLGAMRMLNIFSQIVLSCELIRLVSIDRRIPWFSYLGRHSLQVFSLHVILILILLLAPITWRRPGMFGLAWYCVYLIAVGAILTVGIWIYDRYGEAKKAVSPISENPRCRQAGCGDSEDVTLGNR